MRGAEFLREEWSVAWYLLRWALWTIPLGIVTGSACALFLWLLDQATRQREALPWLLYLLPLAGAGVALVYHWWGRGSDKGNNLILDEIHEPGGGIPWQMAPLVLLGTLVTHLCGGSAGREGTAVQMGGSFAGAIRRWLPWLSSHDHRLLLMAGVAAGFGGVFGTPVAGMIFALEVLTIGTLNYRALWPCLLAALVSDQVCLAWDIHHTVYRLSNSVLLVEGAPLAHWDLAIAGKVVVAGLVFGLVSRLFSHAAHRWQAFLKQWIAWPVFRPVIGGLLVIALVFLLGTREYLGLGVSSANPHDTTILSAFQPGGAEQLSWFWKLVFTVVTVSSGFKGGEVTPLFFIGATLGNTLAFWLDAPVELFAAMGFVAVFSGATNTPLACTMMGIELFGSEYAAYYAAACFLAYLASGHVGIYRSQRVGLPKGGRFGHEPQDGTGRPASGETAAVS